MHPDQIHDLYGECRLCPRNCGVDRLHGKIGYCGESAWMRIAWAGLHLGEEPPLLGEKGSGTIFFSGCTLKCGSCQNCQISHEGIGREISSGELRSLMLRLQERGSANINLVTAGHFTPSIVEVVAEARRRGLAIPVVWNSSGYETISTPERLKETVDVYLPDCKTLDPEVSGRLMGAADYPEVVRPVLLKMVEDKPLIFEREQLRQGVMIRHLVLPGLLDQSREVLEWFAGHIRDRALLSLMFQFTPLRQEAQWDAVHPQRTVNLREYQRVLSWLEELEINHGYVQGPARSDDWLPDFTRLNPFPRGQSVPLWHYQSGYVE